MHSKIPFMGGEEVTCTADPHSARLALIGVVFDIVECIELGLESRRYESGFYIGRLVDPLELVACDVILDVHMLWFAIAGEKCCKPAEWSVEESARPERECFRALTGNI